MKIFKTIGYTGLASTALFVLMPLLTIASSQQESSAKEEPSANIVHRVSYALASSVEYKSNAISGSKWGQKPQATESKAIWADAKSSQSGFKWGHSNFADQTGSKWGRRDFSEQAGSKWGRRDFSEQAGSKWGRRDFSEQAGSKWGRRDFSEQAGSKWGRR